ncbi:hypothetical protein [Lysinibacillus odysseyi]|uniref:Uncharacterized protein n=1 Tax=Lysinibacillus odysseyi 34hs-1 = NBRC 100172 TaxID=1220589 RepID=A0A0A3ISF9_9BACI|nr:hypothetical protein [Lysinibacillus odysseyi]KGR86395.1 hypothetical protein CD32_05755 [Lysinibacillus odysseyi 34hs-1 = NBRC 100172]
MPTQIKTGGDPSMFETVKKHGEAIDTHEQIIEAHEKSIDELKTNFRKLEENDKKQTEKLDLLSSQMSNVVLQNTELKSTILQSSQTQQEFFRDTMSKQWELIKARDDSKEADRKRVHEISLSEHALKKSNAEKRWELLGKVVVSGGIFYLIIESILRMVGGQ